MTRDRGELTRRQLIIGGATGVVGGLAAFLLGRGPQSVEAPTTTSGPATTASSTTAPSATSTAAAAADSTMPTTTSTTTSPPPTTSTTTTSTAAPTTTSTTTTPPPTSTTTTVTTVGEPPPGGARQPPPPSGAPRPDPGTPAVAPGWAPTSIGTTVNGEPIPAYSWAGTTVRHQVLIVSGIHGNEPITFPLARQLMYVPVPEGVGVTIIPSANPDGWLSNSRHNAHGVDLNRNFAWRWASYDGGPAPASEPETQAVMDLIAGRSWALVVWIHQPLGYVAAVPPTPQAFADVWRGPGGLPTRADLDQHGGGESWTAKVADRPSILVEASGWDANPDMVNRHIAGYQAILHHFATHQPRSAL